MKFAPSLAALVRGAAFLNTICNLLPRVFAADQHPSHTITYFEHLPQRLYYFDDTPVSNQFQNTPTVLHRPYVQAMADSGIS